MPYLFRRVKLQYSAHSHAQSRDFRQFPPRLQEAPAELIDARLLAYASEAPVFRRWPWLCGSCSRRYKRGRPRGPAPPTTACAVADNPEMPDSEPRQAAKAPIRGQRAQRIGMTAVAQHGRQLDQIPGARRGPSVSRISMPLGPAQELTGNHHVKPPAGRRLAKDSLPGIEVEALGRAVQQISGRRRTLQQLRQRMRLDGFHSPGYLLRLYGHISPCSFWNPARDEWRLHSTCRLAPGGGDWYRGFAMNRTSWSNSLSCKCSRCNNW
jgi:hypothetical protein